MPPLTALAARAMSIESTILQSLHEHRALQAWRLSGALDAAAAARAEELLGPRPSAAAWRGFVDRLALYLGVLLLGAGVVCWVAYNWDAFDRYAKLYGMQVLLVAAAGGALWRQPDSAAGRALLLLAAIVQGALLALIGQTYQTGADPWQLFAAWAGLLLPWALAARWTPLWLLWVLLVNLALYLWFDVGGRWGWALLLFGGDLSWLAIGAIDLVLLAAWETAGVRWGQVRGRYGARLLLITALAPLTIGALWFVVDIGRHAEQPLWALLAWAGAVALCGGYYLQQRRDIGALALLCMSVIAVAITALGRGMVELADIEFAWLLLCAALVGMSIAASMWLLKLRREDRDADTD